MPGSSFSPRRITESIERNDTAFDTRVADVTTNRIDASGEYDFNTGREYDGWHNPVPETAVRGGLVNYCSSVSATEWFSDSKRSHFSFMYSTASGNLLSRDPSDATDMSLYTLSHRSDGHHVRS